MNESLETSNKVGEFLKYETRTPSVKTIYKMESEKNMFVNRSRRLANGWLNAM